MRGIIVRKSILALFFVLSLTPMAVSALGLGLIDLKSGLNQPLKAEIALLSVSEDDLADIRVKLASSAAFTRAGVDRLFFLAQLRFKTGINAKGKTVIFVTSRDSVKEPFLNFLVELNWPQGRFLREYTMLLDPPITFEKEAPVQIAAPRKSRSTKAGVIRKARVAAAPVKQTKPRKKAVSSSGAHQVVRGDTLYDIAQKYRKQGRSSKQAMMDIFEANPDAFVNNNINRLKSGVELIIKDLGEISQEEALKAYDKQTTAWQKDRKELTNDALEFQAESAQPVKSPVRTQTTAAPSDVFKIDTPTTDGKTGADNELPGEISDSEEVDALKRDFRLANEAAAAQERENEDLRSRLTNLNKQVGKMERLLSLQSDEMASLQQRLVEQGVELSEELKAQLEAELGTETLDTETVDTDVATQTTDGETTDAETAETEAETTETIAEVTVTSDPEETEELGMVDTVLDEGGKLVGGAMKLVSSNPLVAGGIGGFVVLLGIVMLLRRRKAKQLMLDEESILATDEGIGETVITSIETPDSGFSTSSAQLPADDSGLSTDIIDDESFLSDISPTEMTATSDELADEVDPLAEADVYLAYGRYDQAEDLIEQAIENEPGRADYKVKLLEVYYATKDQDKFNQLATEFHTGLDDQSRPLWDRVVTMGIDLCPENALYSGQSTPPAALGGAAGVAAGVGAAGLDSVADPELDFGNLDLGGQEETSIDLGSDLSADIDLGTLGSDTAVPAVEDDFLADLGDTDLSAGLEASVGLDDTDLSAGFGDTDLSAGLGETDLSAGLGDTDLSAGLDGTDLTAGLGGDTDLSVGIDETDFSADLGDDLAMESGLESQEDAGAGDDLAVSLDAFDAGGDYTSDYGAKDFSSSADAFDAPTPAQSSADMGATIEKAAEVSLDLGDDFGDTQAVDLGALGETADTSELSADFTDDALGLGPSQSGGSSEEIETKLELARVYVDMGDPDGARDILKEVLEEGDADQKQLAEEIINGI